MEGDQVGNGLAGIPAIEAVDLLEVGDGDLLHVFADLDLGDDVSLIVLHRRQLVYAAEHRLGPGGDHPLTHAEHIDLGALQKQILDQILVQGVGHGDFAFGPPGVVQHLPGLPGQIRHIAGVQPDAALGDAHGFEHLIEGPDGVGHAGFQGVVGIHQQRGVGGVNFAVRLESIILRVEHLHPGVSHGAPGGHAVQLVRDGAGGAAAAADIRGPCADDGGVGALGPAGAELQHRAAPCSPDDAVGLGGNEALVVDGQQGKGLDKLCFNGRSPHHHQGLLGEHRGPLRHGINVAGKPEISQIFQEFLAEQVPPPKIRNVLLGEVQVLDVVDQLLQARGNGKAALVRHPAEEHVKIRDLILEAVLEIPVAHGQLIKVAEHGHVQLFLNVHPSIPQIFVILAGVPAYDSRFPPPQCNRLLYASLRK